MRARRLVLGLGLLALLLEAGTELPGADDTEALIRQRQEELADLKRRLEEHHQEISRLRAAGADIERVLAELERQRSLTQHYVDKLDTQATAVERDLVTRGAQLTRKEEEIRAARGRLSSAVAAYYKHGRVGAAELLFSSRSFGEIFARAHYWIRAIRNLRSHVLGVVDQSREIQSEITTIESRRRSIAALRAERTAQLAALARTEAERRGDRAELEQTIARYEQQTAKLLASQQRIEGLLEELIAAAQATAGGAHEGLAALQGKLPWPVAGRIITEFGTHVHPRYGTQIKQKGIAIAAPEGTPIKAVAAGTVVFVGWLEGYGRTVIVDHGQGYFTLYAHASEVLVQRGQEVTAGGAVARVGSTDSLKGPCVHFEIRQGPQARNPVKWLRPR